MQSRQIPESGSVVNFNWLINSFIYSYFLPLFLSSHWANHSFVRSFVLYTLALYICSLIFHATPSESPFECSCLRLYSTFSLAHHSLHTRIIVIFIVINSSPIAFPTKTLTRYTRNNAILVSVKSCVTDKNIDFYSYHMGPLTVSLNPSIHSSSSL